MCDQFTRNSRGYHQEPRAMLIILIGTVCSELEGKIFLTQLLHFLNSFFLCLSWCLAVFIYVFGWYIRVCGWPVLQRRGSNVSSFSAGKNYVWVSLTII